MLAGGFLLVKVLDWLQHTKLWQRQIFIGLGALVIGLTAPPKVQAPSHADLSSKPSHQVVSPLAFVIPKSSRVTGKPVRLLRPIPPQGHLYHIQWGDSLWSIAQKFHTSVLDLEEANQLTSTTIYAGKYLVVPDMYTVKPGDTLKSIAQQFGVPLLLLWHENRLVSDKLAPGQTIIIPYTGTVPQGVYSPAQQTAALPLLTSRSLPQTTTYSASDVLLLAHLVQAEAGNQPFVGQVAVAAVVINRLNAPGFPKTLPGVIEDPGQFSSVSNGTIWQAPGPLAFMAAQAALNGWDPTHGALFYFNPNLPHTGWMNSLPVTTEIGSQVFCR